uniref:Uncharacterized protein n=1 Tax=viral metagenome TaxID=1070528 RepID=A0A2V0RH94_9ZZZZ
MNNALVFLGGSYMRAPLSKRISPASDVWLADDRDVTEPARWAGFGDELVTGVMDRFKRFASHQQDVPAMDKALIAVATMMVPALRPWVPALMGASYITNVSRSLIRNTLKLDPQASNLEAQRMVGLLMRDAAIRERTSLQSRGLGTPTCHLADCDCNNVVADRGNPFRFQQTLTEPKSFFSSRMFEARFDPTMPSGLFGEIDLATRPFRVRINPNVVRHRRELSTVHEAMHALNHLYKWNMNHETLHMASDTILTEVIPLLLAQRQAAERFGAVNRNR